MFALPHRLATILALGLATLLTACAAPEPDPFPPFRYRMTVEVETPEGLRSGSAVREVDYEPAGYAGGNFNVFRLKLRGEAVAVDLPDGRVVYALLRSPRFSDFSAHIAIDTLLPGAPGEQMSPGRSGFNPSSPEFETAFAGLLANREIRALPSEPARRWSGGPEETWPLLVTFRDETDPASVVRVYPDNVAATLGRGVTIKRITLAITDDPVTEGIEKRLGWLAQVYDGMLPKGFQPEGVPVGDYRGTFTTENFE
jgi:hypothetical protein